jgi:hypothetical protein
MGDRAQIHIKDTGVYLYTHWDGWRLEAIVQAALARKQRWDDVEYLTRIIFSEMIKKDIDGETGYGIGTALHGDAYKVIEIDCGRQVISIGNLKLTFDGFVDAYKKLAAVEEKE